MNFKWLRKLNPLRTRFYIIKRDVDDFRDPMPDSGIFPKKIIYDVSYRSIDNLFELHYMCSRDTLEEAKQWIEDYVNPASRCKVVFKY